MINWETPLAERMRPTSISEYFGHDSILAQGKPLREHLERGQVPSCIIYGPPGVGKTALVRLMADMTERELFEINAVSAKVSQLRDLIDKAAEFKSLSGGKSAIAFVDEIYHFNKNQQNALLPAVEKGDIILVGTTTENPWFEINKTLLSRLLVFSIDPLKTDDLLEILERALLNREKGLGELELECEEGVLRELANGSVGDARQALTRLEFFASAVSASGGRVITSKRLKNDLPLAALSHDRAGDDHYQVASAMIKSIRGSDPDAAVYWLARQLEAGEDVRFIARRLIISASEDIGLADPMALNIAVSAASGVERTGMPEARIILSEAIIYLASAPKSNSAYLAVNSAMNAVKSGDIQKVPEHLIQGSDKYLYPHDYPGHWVSQPYLNDPRRYYYPGEAGYEVRISDRLKQFWRRFRGASK